MSTPPEIPVPSDAELLAIALEVDLDLLRDAFRAGVEDRTIWSASQHEVCCRAEGSRLAFQATREATDR